MFDSGLVKIYKTENNASAGKMYKEGLTLFSSFLFDERTVGMTRYYAAKQSNSKIDRMIRIWQDRTVKAGYVCVITDGIDDGAQYRIVSIQHTKDKDGLAVSDLTLEEVKEKYAIT